MTRDSRRVGSGLSHSGQRDTSSCFCTWPPCMKPVADRSARSAVRSKLPLLATRALLVCSFASGGKMSDSPAKKIRRGDDLVHRGCGRG